MPSYDSLKHWRQVALSKVAFEFLEGVKRPAADATGVFPNSLPIPMWLKKWEK